MISLKALRMAARELKKAHPEVLGVGLGLRRSQGRVRRRQFVLKVFVQRKFGKRKPKGARLIPRLWKLRIGKDHGILVQLPTDVEEVREFAPSSFDVGPMKAACWMSWFDPANRPRVGVVTASHGLPDVGREIAVTGFPAGGTVLVKSDLEADQTDVGLIEVSPMEFPYPNAGPRNLVPTSADSLINLIGTSSTDGLSTQCEHWSDEQPIPVRAIAFMDSYTIRYPDGRSFKLRNVVVGDGYVGAFRPGYSGGTWATQGPPEFDRIVAIQSHGATPSFDVGVGVHFASAIDWLVQSVGMRQMRYWWHS
jgi:hypothetical protein